MTQSQLESLKLGLPGNDSTLLMVEGALAWVEGNTSYTFDYESLENTPANVRLFIVKFVECMSMSAGVASESIDGLSQSFNSNTADKLLWNYAESLLSGWLKPSCTFVQAVSRWA